ncbi:MAG: NAD-dependent epimerase/dehydratase family protein, partial [Deltaproteobacteria bacterium]
MASVLVTGASGFIGTALAPRLAAAGHVPRLLFRHPPNAAPAGEIVVGDLAEPA